MSVFWKSIAPSLIELLGGGLMGLGAGASAKKDRQLTERLTREQIEATDLASRRGFAGQIAFKQFDVSEQRRGQTNIRRAMANGMAGHVIAYGMPGQKAPGAAEVNVITQGLTRARPGR